MIKAVDCWLDIQTVYFIYIIGMVAVTFLAVMSTIANATKTETSFIT